MSQASPESTFEPTKPVTWLFGLDLLVKLRSMLLFALYGSKLDMRDWMEGKPFDYSDERVERGEYWFDYIADTGDGGRATRAVARMCLADLRASGPLELGTVLRAASTSRQADATPSDGTTLPRGQFLIIGGDTGYHVADYATLAERLQKPFWTAARELGIDEHSERRPLFGLPANHDYYDVLDGFARQFRRPLFSESKPAAGASDFPPPQLQLHGFERLQTASYLALKLPFEWSLWSVDCELGHVDIRQQKFFRDLGTPQNLIVLTPEPSTVYGRKPREDDTTARAFRALGLDWTFEGAVEGRTRLDLSGDVHHYERYFGPSDNPSAPSAPNYASVVCGLGGAFLHPSIVGAAEITPQRVYPEPLKALRVVAPRLLNPLRIAAGGFVWLVGAVIAVLVYAALATFAKDSLAEVRSAATAQDASSAFSATVGPALESTAKGSWGIASVVLAWLPLVGWLIAERRVPRSSSAGERTDRKNSGSWATSLIMTALMGAAVAPGLSLFGGVWGPEPAGATLLTAAGVFIASGFWSVLAVAASVLRRERLFRRARGSGMSRLDYGPNVVAIAAAVIAPPLVLWRFGSAHSAASFVFAALVLGVVSLLTVGLGALAVLGGAGGLPRSSKAVFALFGLHHAAAQLSYPQILVGFGNPATLAVVALGSVVLGLIAVQLAYRGSRSGLLLIWLLQSALVVGAPILTASWMAPFSSWGPAAGAVLVAAIGAAASCISFGAYLLVALVHGGHANEAGAATGIENFKGMVRFKLTERELTAYVIACDDPDQDPRVVDLFSLPSGSAG